MRTDDGSIETELGSLIAHDDCADSDRGFVWITTPRLPRPRGGEFDARATSPVDLFVEVARSKKG
ncbi:MAG: hypothetical protein WCF24_11470 [Acidimicrobiales bacterium]